METDEPGGGERFAIAASSVELLKPLPVFGGPDRGWFLLDPFDMGRDRRFGEAISIRSTVKERDSGIPLRRKFIQHA